MTYRNLTVATAVALVLVSAGSLHAADNAAALE